MPSFTLFAAPLTLLVDARVFIAKVILVIVLATVTIAACTRLGDAQHGGVMHPIELGERAQREPPGHDVLDGQIREFRCGSHTQPPRFYSGV